MTPKEMQELWLSKNKPKILEEYIPSYLKKDNWSLYNTNRDIQISNLKSLNARSREERENKNCIYCNESFKPKRRYKKEKGETYFNCCDKCRNTTEANRILVKKFGSWELYWKNIEQYKSLKECLIPTVYCEINQVKEQIIIREKLNDLIPNKLLQKGIITLKNKLEETEVSIAGYKFDF